MSQPIAYPKFRATDSTTGLALVGGRVYTYLAGTGTPKATYTDSTLSVANTNPVILDARGEADIWPSGAYKIVMADAAGVTLWTVDNITDFTTFTGNLSITGNITGTGNLTINGNSALGDAQGDTLSISGSVIKNASGNYVFPAPSSGTLMTFQGITASDSFVPAGASTPTNGLFLPSANTLGLASNSATRWTVNSTGNHSFNASSSGYTVSVTGTMALPSGGATLDFTANGATDAQINYYGTTFFSIVPRSVSAGVQLFVGNATLSTTWASTGAVTFVGSTTVNGSAGVLGYSAGAGGAVSQATSKSTAVTLNKGTGQITLNNANLAATTTVSFTLNNSRIAATDTVVVNHSSIGNGTDYNVWASTFGSGTCQINVRNITGGALAEAIVLNFTVLKGASS